MKIKTRDELIDLDEELNLFEESDWNFLDVQEGCNLEYFNDIIDDDFRKRNRTDVLRYCLITLTICCTFLVCGVWLYNVTVGRYVLSDADASSTIDRVVELEKIIGGTSASNSDCSEISKLLTSYFNILKNESSYSILDSFCLKSSTFSDTEKIYREKMEYTYDINDCYSRALRCFGAYFSVTNINDVLCKDDTYYVYATLKYPDNNALTEYFYVYANDMSKFFTSNEITEQNVVRYILQLSDTYGLPTSEKEVCIEVCKDSSNNFVILDDSAVTSQCTSAYNYAISQVIKILGVSKATTQYD